MSRSRAQVRRQGVALLLAVGLGLCRVALATPSGASGLEACEARFVAQPEGSEGPKCFLREAQGEAGRDDALRRLRRLIARYPERPWLVLVLGHLELLSRPREAEVAYRRAAEAFRRSGDAEGEVLAGINLRSVLGVLGRTDEAHQWVLRVAEVARASGDPQLQARALILEAAELSDLGRDLGRAHRLLEHAAALSFARATDGLKKQLLSPLATVSANLGRYEKAEEAYTQLSEIARRTGDRTAEARVRFAMANLALRRAEDNPEPGARPALLRLAREALGAAEGAGSKAFEMMSLRLVAELLGDTPAEVLEREQKLERCLSLAQAAALPERRIACLWTRAERRARIDAAAAQADADRALQLAAEHGNPLYLASAWRARATVGFATQPLPVALRQAERALDAVEVLRELQPDGSSQSELFAGWTRDYHRLAGRILEAGQSGVLPSREALERAFTVSERLRARTLFESLASSQALDATVDGPGRKQQRSRVLLDLSHVQRHLLEVAAAEREPVLAQLRELERQEQELRPVLRNATASFVSLAEAEQTLAPDEALLIFLVGDERDLQGEPAGGSWVLTVTRGGTRAARILERARVASAVSLLAGLLERRDGSEAGVAAALYAGLLEPALSPLPAGVSRLLLVPEGPLNDLPFAVLQAHREGAPLLTRFELGEVPSASLLHHWRARPPRPAGGEALILADPTWGVARAPASTGSPARGDVFEATAELQALPGARREGRTVAAALKGTGLNPKLLVGAAASEQALKSESLAGVRLLHVAAHAVVDTEAPERSALVLAPGSSQEDGMLQPREIAALHLEDALVVLSSCRSASGAVLAGEGVLSLARAFFEAGARAVVASLWPLRDDEAAWLLERYYRHLAAGERAGSALRSAQLEARAEGRPAAAWAGLVVLGDSALVPAPKTPVADGHAARGTLVFLLLPALVLVGAGWWRRRRRRRRLA